MVTWKGESQPAKKFSFPIFLFLNQVELPLPEPSVLRASSEPGFSSFDSDRPEADRSVTHLVLARAGRSQPVIPP